jgi:hypothetical protein
MMLANSAEEYPLSKVSKNVPDNKLKREEPSSYLLLRGEMRYIKDWHAIIYLCNPL